MAVLSKFAKVTSKIPAIMQNSNKTRDFPDPIAIANELKRIRDEGLAKQTLNNMTQPSASKQSKFPDPIIENQEPKKIFVPLEATTATENLTSSSNTLKLESNCVPSFQYECDTNQKLQDSELPRALHVTDHIEPERRQVPFNGFCFRCKQRGHKVQCCPKPRTRCFICGRTGHLKRNCIMRYDCIQQPTYPSWNNNRINCHVSSRAKYQFGKMASGFTYGREGNRNMFCTFQNNNSHKNVIPGRNENAFGNYCRNTGCHIRRGCRQASFRGDRFPGTTFNRNLQQAVFPMPYQNVMYSDDEILPHTCSFVFNGSGYDPCCWYHLWVFKNGDSAY